jgi:phospholipase C
VRPPRVVDDRSSRDLFEDFGQMGFRIPAVAISPYSRRGSRRPEFRVDHGTYGFESILKLISYRFGLGHLNKRMRYARNVGHSFDWRSPDFERPSLPDPPDIVTAPCGLGGGDVQDSRQAHASDLAGLEELALRHGVPVYEGKLGDIFSLPDTVQRAVRARPR